jgi:hypothetical protein
VLVKREDAVVPKAFPVVDSVKLMPEQLIA